MSQPRGGPGFPARQPWLAHVTRGMRQRRRSNAYENDLCASNLFDGKFVGVASCVLVHVAKGSRALRVELRCAFREWMTFSLRGVVIARLGAVGEV